MKLTLSEKYFLYLRQSILDSQQGLAKELSESDVQDYRSKIADTYHSVCELDDDDLEELVEEMYLEDIEHALPSIYSVTKREF